MSYGQTVSRSLEIRLRGKGKKRIFCFFLRLLALIFVRARCCCTHAHAPQSDTVCRERQRVREKSLVRREKTKCQPWRRSRRPPALCPSAVAVEAEGARRKIQEQPNLPDPPPSPWEEEARRRRRAWLFARLWLPARPLAAAATAAPPR